jgi:phosphoglycolate phosphatase
MESRPLENILLGIFDHSGVLSDDRLPVYEANRLLLERYGLPQISFAEWLKASKASAGEFLHSLGATAPLDQINQEYKVIYTELGNREPDPIKPTMYPNAPQVLETLKKEKKMKLAIVSSHPRTNLISELEEYGIAQFFDEISGDPSPKTQRIISICSLFEISPSQTIFVEDTVYGLESGRKAGVNCFGITTGYHSRERLEAEGTAVAVIDSLTELLRYL